MTAGETIVSRKDISNDRDAAHSTKTFLVEWSGGEVRIEIEKIGDGGSGCIEGFGGLK